MPTRLRIHGLNIQFHGHHLAIARAAARGIKGGVDYALAAWLSFRDAPSRTLAAHALTRCIKWVRPLRSAEKCSKGPPTQAAFELLLREQCCTSERYLRHLDFARLREAIACTNYSPKLRGSYAPPSAATRSICARCSPLFYWSADEVANRQ